MADKDPRIWIKVAVDLPDAPKVEALSDGAFRALIEMLCYSRDKLTDGVLRDRIAEKRWGRHLEELCTNDDENPSLIRVEGGYKLHDYEKHQETRADVEARKARLRANGAKGGRPRKPRNNQLGSETETNLVTNLDTNLDTYLGGNLGTYEKAESRVQSPEGLSIKTLSSQSSSTRARELSTDPETNKVLMEKAGSCGFTEPGQVWALMEELKARCDRDIEPYQVFNLIKSIVNKSKVDVRNPLAYALTAIENDPTEIMRMIDAGIPWEQPRLEAV